VGRVLLPRHHQPNVLIAKSLLMIDTCLAHYHSLFPLSSQTRVSPASLLRTRQGALFGGSAGPSATAPV